MKKLAHSVLAAALLTTSAQAEVIQPVSDVTDADPALWVMKDHDTTIYLFGTIHILKGGLSWFDEGVEAAFNQSDELMTEVLESDLKGLNAKMKVKGYNSRGPNLSQRLNPRDRAIYISSVKSLGLPLSGVERLEPWAAAMMFGVLPLLKKGYDPESGAEKVLDAAAAAADKRRSAFETASEQLGFFTSMPERVQIAQLGTILRGIATVDRDIGELVTAWSTGDLDGLGKSLNRAANEDPAFYKILLTDRNARWVEKLDARMDQPGTVFVAVGAGHLAGKDSVQDLLQARGFRVERVRY